MEVVEGDERRRKGGAERQMPTQNKDIYIRGGGRN